jgi:hypothetical protein
MICKATGLKGGKDAAQIVGKGIASHHVPHIAGVVAPVSARERRGMHGVGSNQSDVRSGSTRPRRSDREQAWLQAITADPPASRVTRMAAADPSQIEPNPRVSEGGRRVNRKAIGD